MRNVFDYFGLHKRTKGDVGLEIEVEGVNLPWAKKFWNNEEDGSLKGPESREYVLKCPLDLEGVKESLDYLDALYIESNTEVHETVRAGVHVHINCQDLTISQLYNFITIYLILEEMMVKWCGENREGNLFCLRSMDADFLLAMLIKAARMKKFQLLFSDDLRYGSMNVKALGTYGSLEFRAMRGTRDLSLIYKWAEMLLSLREKAKEYDRPSDIIREFSGGYCEQFVRGVLGDNADQIIMMDGFEGMLKDGMRRAQDVAFCTDWSKYVVEPVRNIGGINFPVGAEPDEPIGDV